MKMNEFLLKYIYNRYFILLAFVGSMILYSYIIRSFEVQSVVIQYFNSQKTPAVVVVDTLTLSVAHFGKHKAGDSISLVRLHNKGSIKKWGEVVPLSLDSDSIQIVKNYGCETSDMFINAKV